MKKRNNAETPEDLGTDSVNFYQLILFLYLQQYNNYKDMIGTNGINNQQLEIQYIKKELSNMIQLVNPLSNLITRDQFDTLDLLFAGGVSFKAKVCNFTYIIFIYLYLYLFLTFI